MIIRNLLIQHIESSHFSLLNRVIPMLYSYSRPSDPVREISDISSSKDIRLRCLQEGVHLNRSIWELGDHMLGKLGVRLYAETNDNSVSFQD